MFSKATIPAAFAACALFAAAQSASAAIVITEWMYQGGSGEFVEFTNIGTGAIDMTGWVYDDDSRISVGSEFGSSTTGFDLSGFGTVLPGESVLITETTAAVFRADWGLAESVKVLGGFTNNLGRADEINLYDNGGNLIDRLTYGDNAIPGTIRTQGFSGRPADATALGDNDATLWVLSAPGDIEASFISQSGATGSPGFTSFAPAPVPVPAALPLLLGALSGLGLMGRRRRA